MSGSHIIPPSPPSRDSPVHVNMLLSRREKVRRSRVTACRGRPEPRGLDGPRTRSLSLTAPGKKRRPSPAGGRRRCRPLAPPPPTDASAPRGVFQKGPNHLQAGCTPRARPSPPGGRAPEPRALGTWGFKTQLWWAGDRHSARDAGMPPSNRRRSTPTQHHSGGGNKKLPPNAGPRRPVSPPPPARHSRFTGLRV